MKTKKLYLALGLGLSLAFTGCSSDSSDSQTTHSQETVAIAQTGQTTAPKDNQTLTGTIAETFNSAGYTYILLDNGHDKIWTAISETKVDAGQNIALKNGPVMKDFHSRSLDRTFPKIIFSGGIKGEKNTGHNMMGKTPNKKTPKAKDDEANFMAALDAHKGGDELQLTPAQASGGSSKAIVNAVDINVTKATGENAYTVEEIYTKAKDLNGKPILIHAKVVKVSPHIMGKNWLHLQDGSGNSMQNTHDLVVTTKDTPELDSIITIEGIVAAQKDFGAGYFYEVIVEEGVIKK